VIVDVEVSVARPRAEVFDLMADARNETAWNSQATSSELVSEEPIGAVLRATFDLTPLGFMKVLLPLMAPLVRRDFPKQLNSFKSFCEAR
jgi:hypothetical protein